MVFPGGCRLRSRRGLLRSRRALLRRHLQAVLRRLVGRAEAPGLRSARRAWAHLTSSKSLFALATAFGMIAPTRVLGAARGRWDEPPFEWSCIASEGPLDGRVVLLSFLSPRSAGESCRARPAERRRQSVRRGKDRPRGPPSAPLLRRRRGRGAERRPPRRCHRPPFPGQGRQRPWTSPRRGTAARCRRTGGIRAGPHRSPGGPGDLQRVSECPPSAPPGPPSCCAACPASRPAASVRAICLAASSCSRNSCGGVCFKAHVHCFKCSRGASLGRFLVPSGVRFLAIDALTRTLSEARSFYKSSRYSSLPWPYTRRSACQPCWSATSDDRLIGSHISDRLTPRPRSACRVGREVCVCVCIKSLRVA